jgi:CspA family cold shock protein
MHLIPLREEPIPTTPISESSEVRARPEQVHPTPDQEQMCDLLSQVELGQELTELRLNALPTLTGVQILQIRQSTLEIAERHGRVDF